MSYPKEVVKGIFLVELTIPLSVFTVNCYLIVKGKDILLVDAGIANEHCFSQLAEAIKCLGLDLNNLRGVVITHAHIDHFGLASQLQELTGASVYLHLKESQTLNVLSSNLLNGKTGALWFKENGVSPKEIALLQQDFSNYTPYVTDVSPNNWIKDGDIIPFPGENIQVVWTPGHTPGHVCLYIRERSVLIAGDHILKDRTTHVGDFWWVRGNPLQDYFTSLDIIKNLNPKLILPAHGNPFEDALDRCIEIEDYRLKRNNRILESLALGRKNAWELVKDIWGDALDMGQKRLALADVAAHLKFLLYTGLVQCEKVENWLFWGLA